MAKVLVVDDEKSIQFSFALILADEGYEVFKAENQFEALAILRSNEIDVAVVDRLLGAFNGMDLIEYIKKTHSLCTTILISAYPSFKSASEGFKHGLFAYLEKPVKKNELCKTVEGAVKNSKERQAIYNEIANNMATGSRTTAIAGRVNRDITQVSQATGEMNTGSRQIMDSARDLSKLAENLDGMVSRFKI